MNWISVVQPPTESGDYLVFVKYQYCNVPTQGGYCTVLYFDLSHGGWENFGVVAWQSLPKNPYWSESGAINQCPRCRTLGVTIATSFHQKKPTTYFIYCWRSQQNECGLKGQESTSKEGAVAAWNDPCWRSKLQQRVSK